MLNESKYLKLLIIEELNKLIINEITEYRDDDIVTANEIDLQHEYNKFNQQLFDGVLPRVPLKWDNSKRRLGVVRSAQLIKTLSNLSST